MKKLVLICFLLTFFANPSQAGKKKNKNKGEVDPNAAKIAKCKKEEKKLAKCVSKGTYDVDFEEMGTLYLDFVTKFKKSKEYKKIAKATAAVKKDDVVEDYLSSTEFMAIGELHALEYLDTADGKVAIAQRLEEEYRPEAEQRLLEHDEKLYYMSLIAVDLVNHTRSEIAVLIADDFALIEQIMSLEAFEMENMEDVDDFIEIPRPEIVAVDPDNQDTFQYFKELFLFDSADIEVVGSLTSEAPPRPQARGGNIPFYPPMQTAGRYVFDDGPDQRMNYNPWDFTDFNYKTDPGLMYNAPMYNPSAPMYNAPMYNAPMYNPPMNNPMMNPMMNPMFRDFGYTEYSVYNNLPTNAYAAPQNNPQYGPLPTNSAGPPAVEESIEGRNIFDLINPNGFLQPAVPVPVVTLPPEVVDDQWAVHFEDSEGESSEEQEVRESVVDRMKFFMG